MNVKLGKRVLSALLPFGMLLTLLPTAAFAVEGSPGDGTALLANDSAVDGLKLDKTAQLEDNGTYTIRLDAYATGKVETTITTEREPVPTDFILVLDQSGSMEQSRMDGIPGDGYERANNVTNEQLASGHYYYKVGENYYRVNVTKEQVSSETVYVDRTGNTYSQDQVSNTWEDSYGAICTAQSWFVTSTAKTYTRKYSWPNYYYENDADSSDRSSGRTGATAARNAFTNKYERDGYKVEFNNGANDQYTAVVYMPVTLQQINTYKYTYSYVDADGVTHDLGSSETGTETELNNAIAGVSPLYTRNTTSGTRLDGLKYAANNFIDAIESTGVDHRVAIVGFASDGKVDSGSNQAWENTELFVGGTQYNYSRSNDYGQQVATDTQYGAALQDVTTEAGRANLDASINALDGSGATYPQYGLEMAANVFDAYEKKNDNTYTDSQNVERERARVVIFLTDGTPGYSTFEDDVANATISEAQGLKNGKASVYVVACLDETPGTGSNVDNYLKSVSSNNSYQLASTATALDDFFADIEQSVTDTEISADVSLSEDSFLVDELSSYFTLPEDFSTEKNVAVYTAQHEGNEVFSDQLSPAEGLTVEERTTEAGSERIFVSGFDYDSDANVVTTNNGVGNGCKLVVIISGLLAKDEAAMGDNVAVATNTDNSGIWDVTDEGVSVKVKEFPIPETYLDKQAFVLDYAKKTNLDVYGATKVDSADDKIFSKVDKDSTSLDGNYGEIATADGQLTYAPNTTNWNGWDTFYALGQDDELGDAATRNIWTKVSVIPANNVYYEDDFVTSDATGTVGIEYTGDWTIDGTTSGNTGEVDSSAEGDGHGWIASKDDDTGYSDGSAHKGTTDATATFTFTGTGVDIYSKTDSTTGVVVARLYKGEDTTAAADMVKYLTVDNLSQSDENGYYQIPTLFFNGLDQGTYTVKLTVTAAAADRTTYYLDGIRVYNPLSDAQEQEDDVQEAYDDEIGASFQSVREILLDTGDVNKDGVFDQNGAVFIDYDPDTPDEHETAVVGTYEDYGPKNEVYLASGQAIYVNVGDATPIAIGLKGPEGKTAAQVTQGSNTAEFAINGASDQYYTITPNADGSIIVENSGDNLLSVTKLKMSGEQEILTVDNEVMMAYAASFNSLPVVDYAPAEEPEEPATEEPAEEETTPEEPEQGDVVIENPEEPEEEKPAEPVSNSWVGKLFSAISKLFGF